MEVDFHYRKTEQIQTQTLRILGKVYKLVDESSGYNHRRKEFHAKRFYLSI